VGDLADLRLELLADQRERLHDLEDLGHRLMRQLVGQDHAPSREQLPDNAILIARAMGPAALLDYDRKRLRGLVLEEGTANSHVAIVARALGIPAVGEIPNAPGIAVSSGIAPRAAPMSAPGVPICPRRAVNTSASPTITWS